MSRKLLVPFQLPADPTLALEAATKQYVDNNVGMSQAAADARYVNVAGDGMTGALTVPSLFGNGGANQQLLVNACYLPYSDGVNYYNALGHQFRAQDNTAWLQIISSGANFYVPIIGPNATLTGGLTLQGTSPIFSQNLNGDLGVIRTPDMVVGKANYEFAYTFPQSPVFIPEADNGMFLASGYMTPSLVETSPDNSTWTTVSSIPAKTLFSMPGNNVFYPQTTKYLRITVDFGTTYVFPTLVALKGVGGNTSAQGRILVIEKLDASGGTVGVSTPTTYGPTDNVLIQEAPLILQAISAYDGGTQKLRITIEFTTYVAGNQVNWRSLNIYANRPYYSVQSRYPFSWDENKTVTFQSNAIGASALIAKRIAGQTANIFAIKNEAGTDLAVFDPSGNLFLSTVTATNILGLGSGGALAINNGWMPYVDGSNYYNGNSHVFRPLSAGGTWVTISPSSVDCSVPVVLPADPTTALQAATKQYVDNKPAPTPAYVSPLIKLARPAIKLATPGAKVKHPNPIGGNPAGTSVVAKWSPDGRFLLVGSQSANWCTLFQFNGALLEKMATQPPSIPTSQINGASWHPSGTFFSIASINNPYAHTYSFDGSTAYKLANLSPLPAGQARDVAWHPSGDFLAVAHSTNPCVTVYQFDGVKTFTKLADPDVLPAGSGYSCAWSPDGTYLLVGHLNTPWMSMYAFDGKNLVKVADPAVLTTNDVMSTDWSPDGKYVAVGYGLAPRFSVYTLTGGVLVNPVSPAVDPSVSPKVSWSPDGRYLAVGVGGTPFIHTYFWDGTTLQKLSSTMDAATSTGGIPAWSPDGRFVALPHSGSPYLALYDTCVTHYTDGTGTYVWIRG